MDKINSQYKKMILQTKIDGENYTDKQMQQIYKQQKATLDYIHSYIAKLYIKYAKDGLLVLTPAQKETILSELDAKLKAIAKNLGQAEINTVTAILSRNYTDCYYKNAYILDSGKGGDTYGRH